MTTRTEIIDRIMRWLGLNKPTVATLVIIKRRGAQQVLLGVRKNESSFGTGKLNGPGGKLERDETLLECAVRETREEFGVEVNPKTLKKVAIITFHARGVPDYLVHVYITYDFVGEPKKTESMDPGWYDYGPEKINDLAGNMLESDQRWFPLLINGYEFCADVFYKERAKGFLDIRYFPFAG